MFMKPRILVVEDESALAEEICTALRRNGYSCATVVDGFHALDVIKSERPDLVLLDVQLPGLDGFQVAKTAIDKFDVPVIFMTARDTTADRVMGLRLGAEDYLSKPFSLAELTLRVARTLRNTGIVKPALTCGPLRLDEETGDVSFGATELALTKTEFQILTVLLRAKGRLVTKESLVSQVWGYNEFDPNIVEVPLSTMRKKLREVGAEDLIETKRGLGYLLRASSDNAA